MPRLGHSLSRFLSRTGRYSRAAAERLVNDGRVSVNGVLRLSGAVRVTPSCEVLLDGKPVAPPPPLESARLWRYHKPAGLLTTHDDPQGRPTVFGSLPSWMPRVVSAGRLDAMSEGLLLLTTHGVLARALEAPAAGHVRVYHALVASGARRVTASMRRQLEEGLTLRDGTAFRPILTRPLLPREVRAARYEGHSHWPAALSPGIGGRAGEREAREREAREREREAQAQLRGESSGASNRSSRQWFECRLSEGKNREVRKAWRHFGFAVPRLVRVAYGPFSLAGLPPSMVEEASPAEALSLLRRAQARGVQGTGG